MAINYPKFGAQAGFVKTTKSERADQAELQYGRHAEVLVKSTTKECSATKSDCSWGIEPSSFSADPYDPYLSERIFPLDSVKLDITDEMDPKFTAAQEGTIDATKALIKVLNGCCLVKRAKTTLSISGKGDPAIALGSTFIPSPLKSAIGTLDIGATITTLIDNGAVFRVQNYSVNDSDNDWQNFSIEYQAFIDSDIEGSSIAKEYVTTAAVTPPSCACPDLINDCCDTYKIDWTLSGTGYGEISATITKHPFANPIVP